MANFNARIISFVLSLCLLSINLSAQVSTQDSLALVDIYNATNGPQWNNNTNWLTTTPVDTWEGIIVEDNRVKYITLANNNLSGNIPASLNNLTALTGLGLSYNQITSLPTISDLSDLENFLIDHNQLTSLPDLGNQNNLVYLICNDNQLTSIPSLDYLVNLTHLYVGMNPLTSFPNIENLINLQGLWCFDNGLTELPAIESCPNLNDLWCLNNQLSFQEIERVFNHPNFSNFISFNYHDQTFTPEISGNLGVPYNDSLTIAIPSDGANSLYEWFLDGISLGAPSPDNFYTITQAVLADEGAYTCEITNTLATAVTLTSTPHAIFVAGIDEMGGQYVHNQLIVDYGSGLTQAEKEELAELYGATIVGSCMCGEDVELWQFDSLYMVPIEIPFGDAPYINDPNTLGEAASNDPDVDDAGFNYIVEGEQVGQTGNITFQVPAVVSEVQNTTTLITALIDSGIDQYTEDPYVLQTPDADNCLDNDTHGWDFAEFNNNPQDVLGHGTFMHQIMTNNLSSNINVASSNIKVFNSQEKGKLFEIICGIYYAKDARAKVVNMSLGYSGLPTSIMKTALKKSWDANKTIFVTSAGNDFGINNDEVFYYPSGYAAELGFVLSIAALNPERTGIAAYSNYGVNSVHIAAPGSNVVLQDGTITGSGTSQAAALVSRFIISYLHKYPHADLNHVKSAIQDIIVPMEHQEDNGKVLWGGKFDFAATAVVSNISCYGAADGQITVNVSGGVSPYQYKWTDGTTTSFLSNASAGIYQVTITDNIGWQVVENYIIAESQPLEVFTDYTLDANGSTYTITTNMVGGTAPYHYQWSSGETTKGISVTNLGTYQVTVTDAAGCSAVTDVEVIPLDCADLPIIQTINVVSGNVARINWDDAAGVDLYEFGYSKDALWNIASTPISYRILDNLRPKTNYQFKVRSRCSNSWSPWVTGTFTTLDDFCDRPSWIDEVWVNPTTVTLNWEASTDAIKYRVRYKMEGGSWGPEVHVYTNNYDLENVVSGTNYRFAVNTKCTNGWTGWSDVYHIENSNSNRIINPNGTGTTDRAADTSQKAEALAEGELLSISPNPVHDKATIKIAKGNTDELYILNTQGQKVQVISVHDQTKIVVDISKLESGFYFVKSNSGKATAKFIKL